MLALILCALALFQPPSSGAIHGVIVDSEGGTPLRRVAIRLQLDGRTTVTDDEGRFDIPDVPAGEQELYVSAVDFMLVRRAVTVTAGATVDVTIALSAGTSTYTETVTVRGVSAAAPRREPEVAAEQTLVSTELQQLRGLLTNDPFRAVQMLPGVATGDDFRSEFAVRGLAVADMNVTFEGVASPFLVHTVQDFPESGSVAMINGDVLAEMSLLNGAYPERYGNRLGAELNLRMREGSRDQPHAHVSVSMTDAAVVAEGPLGRSQKGAWLASVRKSYLDFALRQLSLAQGVAFGFEDVQGKLVYDVTPRHQVQLALTLGQSALHVDSEELDLRDLEEGTNASAIAVGTWRYLPSPRMALHQRVAFTANQFQNTTKGGVVLDHGRSHDSLYRADWTFAPSTRVSFEAGGELRWSAIRRKNQLPSGTTFRVIDDFEGSAATTSAYAQTRWMLPRGASIAPGVRLDHWALTGHTAASPWVGSSWPLKGSLALRAGGGLYRHDPDFLETLSRYGSPDLDGQRAWDVEAGIEGLFGSAWRWQLTWYNREDRGRLRLPGAEQHLVNDRYVPAVPTSRYVNALYGNARGGELVVQRRSANGLSGWLSYAYGQNRYDDRTTGESFWGDFDQRHTINLFGMYRLTDRMSTSARFRAGSNFPATGYFREEAGVEYLNDVRNTRRIPYYARLDLRLNRTFNWERKRLTLYLEGLNVLARHNVRLGVPNVNRRTFVVSDLFDSTIPLIPSIGLLLEL